MADFNLQDYAAMRELECGHKKGWGTSAAIWVLVGIVVLGIIFWAWNKGCTEKRLPLVWPTW